MSNTTVKMGDRKVHIWDNPESRIRFLETVLKGKDWEAIVHADPAKSLTQGKNDLSSIARDLDRTGFVTRLEADEHGQPMLYIHHVGDEIGVLASIHELGLVEGARKTLFNLDQPFNQGMKHTRDFLMGVTENPAKALGGLYLFSDLFYVLSEGYSDARKAKSEGHHTTMLRESARHYTNLFNGKEMEKSLMSFAGLMTTINSTILLCFAHDGREEQLKTLNKQMHEAIAQGIDPLQPEVWKDRSNDEHSLISGVTNFLKRHPIEAASISQVIGQIGQFASGNIRYRQGVKAFNANLKSEGFNNMARAAASALSWCVFMLPNKSIDEKDPNLLSPKRWLQEFQDNPQRLSAAISASASIFGVRAAIKGDKPMQKWAEMSYLLGDATMLFVNKSHYGVEGAAAQEALGKAAAQFIVSAPLVFDAESEKQFVASLGRYLASRSIEENLSKKISGIDARTLETAKAEMLETLAPQVSQAIFKELAGRREKLAKIAHSVAQVLELLPVATRENAKKSISESISTMPGVYVNPETLAALVSGEEQKLASAAMPEKPQRAPSMTVLAKSFSELVYALPGLGSAQNALKLYDVITPLIQPGPQDLTILDHALKTKAAADLGIPTHMAASLQPVHTGR